MRGSSRKLGVRTSCVMCHPHALMCLFWFSSTSPLSSLCCLSSLLSSCLSSWPSTSSSTMWRTNSLCSLANEDLGTLAEYDLLTGSLRQTCGPQKNIPTVLISREKGLRRAQYKTVLQSLFEQSTHQLAFRRSRQRWACQVCKQSMGETSLVRWQRADPCAGEIQTICRVLGTLLGVQQARAGAYIPIGWKIEHPSRCHVVLELCSMDFSIFMQTEYAMFRRDQGVGAKRFEQYQARLPARCEDDLAVTRDGDRRAVGIDL